MKKLALFLALLAGAAHADAPAFSVVGFEYSLTLASWTPVTLPATDTPKWGTTVAQIPTLFAYNMLLNFQNNVNLNAMVTGMDNFMLARLSTELAAHDASGYTVSILDDAAKRLSAANLQRLAATFGPGPIAAALPYAPATVAAAYKALPALAPYPLSTYWWAKGLGAGTTDAPGQLYLYDVFLDSYTAGAGGATLPALQATSHYMNRVVKNLFVDAVVVVAAVFAILDSPTAQQLGTELGDWWSFTWAEAVATSTRVVTPPPEIDPIPVPDPDLPVLPGIEGDVPTWDVVCEDGTMYC